MKKWYEKPKYIIPVGIGGFFVLVMIIGGIGAAVSPPVTEKPAVVATTVDTGPSPDPIITPTNKPSVTPKPNVIKTPVAPKTTETPKPVKKTVAPKPVEKTTLKPTKKVTQKDVYYANCDAVRQAGKAPLSKNEPGYRKGLDRDGDGIACDK